MDKKLIAVILISIVALISLVLAINTTMKLSGSEWVCIAQECKEFVTGNEWVNQNCKLDTNNQMMCEFEYEGENYRVPLSGVNVSNMISCKEYQCSSKVLISYGK